MCCSITRGSAQLWQYWFFTRSTSAGLKLELLQTGYPAGASLGLWVSKLAALKIGVEWARGNNVKNPHFSSSRDKPTAVSFVWHTRSMFLKASTASGKSPAYQFPGCWRSRREATPEVPNLLWHNFIPCIRWHTGSTRKTSHEQGPINILVLTRIQGLAALAGLSCLQGRVPLQWV